MITFIIKIGSICLSSILALFYQKKFASPTRVWVFTSNIIEATFVAV